MAGRDRVDLEGLSGRNIARLGQGHDLRQLGAKPGAGGFGKIWRLRHRASLRVIVVGFALADNRRGRNPRFFLPCRDRLARGIGVAIIQNQCQPGLRLIASFGGHDRREGGGGAKAREAHLAPILDASKRAKTASTFPTLVAHSIGVSETVSADAPMPGQPVSGPDGSVDCAPGGGFVRPQKYLQIGIGNAPALADVDGAQRSRLDPQPHSGLSDF